MTLVTLWLMPLQLSMAQTSHITHRLVLPSNANGVSDTIKIIPNGTAAVVVPIHIINYTKTPPHYTQPAFHIRTLTANHTSSLVSQGYTEVKFSVPANITNVYFSVAAEVVG
ncbi:MAG: hypothetical protein WAM14_21215, partial [Candidatus Nitrosopolaris sp.]